MSPENQKFVLESLSNTEYCISGNRRCITVLQPWLCSEFCRHGWCWLLRHLSATEVRLVGCLLRPSFWPERVQSVCLVSAVCGLLCMSEILDPWFYMVMMTKMMMIIILFGSCTYASVFSRCIVKLIVVFFAYATCLIVLLLCFKESNWKLLNPMLCHHAERLDILLQFL